MRVNNEKVTIKILVHFGQLNKNGYVCSKKVENYFVEMIEVAMSKVTLLRNI